MTDLDLSADHGRDRFRHVLARDRARLGFDDDLARWLLVEPAQLPSTGDPDVAGYDGPEHLRRWFGWAAPFAFPDWFLEQDGAVVARIAARDAACLDRLGVDRADLDLAHLARYSAQDHWLVRADAGAALPRPRVVLDLGPGHGRLANPFLHGPDRAAALVAVEGIAGPYLTQRAYYAGLGLQVADYLDTDVPDEFDPVRLAATHDVIHLPTWRLDLVPEASVDLVLAVQVLRELPAPTVRFVLDHLRRVVRPGGGLYVRDHGEGHDLTGLPTDELVVAHGFAPTWAPPVRDRVDLHGVPRVWRRLVDG